MKDGRYMKNKKNKRMKKQKEKASGGGDYLVFGIQGAQGNIRGKRCKKIRHGG